MRDHVLFQMWEPFRQSLIKGHLFYFDQAQKRLISQFEDIEAESEKASEEWLERSSDYFDPDRHDPGDFYEAANEAGIEFYSLLSEMRDQTCLSVVAGMFHECVKQLRDWLVREIQHWHQGDMAAEKVWSANFEQITKLLESIGWTIVDTEYFRVIDACRLVVNVYKHGKGNSLNDLKQKYPKYLRDPLLLSGEYSQNIDIRDHNHLNVSKDQLQGFSDAILEFWRAVPENIYASQVTDVPDWFGKALKKDQTDQRQRNSK